MSDPYRLSTDVVPTRYQLEIEPDLDGGTFRGVVVVDLDATSDVDEVTCNAIDLRIESASFDDVPAETRLDEATERLHLSPGAPLTAGAHTLRIAYSGDFNEQLVGFYRSEYEDDDGTHFLGVTQFEAPHARRAFPCWDEPSFKATFEVRLIVDDGELAVSNCSETGRETREDGKVAVAFAPTIPMSTYLVAWLTGRLVATDPVDVDGVAVRVICRPGQEHLTTAAVDVAAHALRWFTEYYGIPYPGDKVDLVAVPDFGFGAMENFGCITFREVLLLLDPDALTQAEYERATTVIEHELAHMWFGDLVTMRWWDGIWLNEAFATFMELSCADDYRPDWNVWTTFGPARSQAFATDATTQTRPIEFEVHSPSDADAMFDVLTYEKGASVLRMIEQYIGPETFREGIRRYLDRHQYSNTDSSDLWAALDEVTDTPVSRVMNSWIHQGGHPVITVSSSGHDSIELTQRRFGYGAAGQEDDRRWAVPIRWRAGTADGIVDDRLLLDDDTADITLAAPAQWVVANAEGLGFYRTAYDDDAFGALAAAVAQLHPLERFGLVDDSWALMLGDIDHVARVADALRAVRDDPHPAVVRRSLAALGELRLLGGAAGRDAIATFARELVADRNDDDPEVDGLVLRIQGVTGADPAAIERAAALIEGSDRGDDVHPELLAAAVDVAASNGGEAEFELFLARFHGAETPQEEMRYLSALTRFSSPELIDRVLEMCATEVRSQNAPYALAQAMANPVMGGRAWEFIRDRWTELVARFPDSSLSRMVGGVRSLWEPDVAADVLEFFSVDRLSHSERQIAQHLETVRTHQAAREREREHLADALR